MVQEGDEQTPIPEEAERLRNLPPQWLLATKADIIAIRTWGTPRTRDGVRRTKRYALQQHKILDRQNPAGGDLAAGIRAAGACRPVPRTDALHS
jgi:hypothetical protein